jgi:hypothetical protein
MEGAAPVLTIAFPNGAQAGKTVSLKLKRL